MVPTPSDKALVQHRRPGAPEGWSTLHFMGPEHDRPENWTLSKNTIDGELALTPCPPVGALTRTAEFMTNAAVAPGRAPTYKSKKGGIPKTPSTLTSSLRSKNSKKKEKKRLGYDEEAASEVNFTPNFLGGQSLDARIIPNWMLAMTGTLSVISPAGQTDFSWNRYPSELRTIDARPGCPARVSWPSFDKDGVSACELALERAGYSSFHGPTVGSEQALFSSPWPLSLEAPQLAKRSFPVPCLKNGKIVNPTVEFTVEVATPDDYDKLTFLPPGS